MDFEQWDVVLASFPFSEQARSKLRPIVVLSQASFSRESGLVIVAMITTAAAGRTESDHELIDLDAAGLIRPCVVRVKIATLTPSFLARRLGSLAAADRVGVGQKVATVIPLVTGGPEPSPD